MSEVLVAVTIDTEEDDWGSYAASGQTVANIALFPRLQELFDLWGARPTYFVNRPPLMERGSVEVLGGLAGREGVEIGAHCHPWNTPPNTGAGVDASMMLHLPEAVNLAKLSLVTETIEAELGVRPRSFRTGRWGFGRSVSLPLSELGFSVDSSVSPFVDWSDIGGPDYSNAPHEPSRFDPEHPLKPTAGGSMAELPTTVGFLRGDARRSNAVRRRLERSVLARLKAVGLLDRAGVLARRWLSPETSSAAELVRLADNEVARGRRYLDLTFHSCTLLPGATPFVRSDEDQRAFLDRIGVFLRFARDSGFRFATVSQAAETLLPRSLAS